MNLLPIFDPANPASGEFNLNLTGGRGKAVIYNESSSNLRLTFSNGNTAYVPAWTAVMYCFLSTPMPSPVVQYDTVSVLQNIVVTSISQVAIEIYEVNESVGGTYPASLLREMAVANNVSTSVGTTNIVNDGNPAVTSIVEATQQGNTGGSNVQIGNDGSFQFAQWQGAAYDNLLQLIPSGAGPLLRLGAGLILEAVDQSGLNLSHIFGVDSGGNTFAQAHKTNNQFVVYDKNGIATAKFDANNMLNVTGASQSNNGDTSGTQTIIEAFYGAYQIVFVKQANYRQIGTGVQQQLKNAFHTGAIWINGGCGGLVAQNGSTSQQSNQITWGTGTSAGTSAGGTGIPSFAAGVITTAFNFLGDSGGYANAHNGLGLFIGM